MNESGNVKNGLFDGAGWQENACLNFSRNPAHGYIEGYRKAAGILVRHINDLGTGHDYLVYPIVFLYRHHLELRLKNLIEKGSLLLDENPLKNLLSQHSLDPLWGEVKRILTRIEPGAAQSLVGIECVIEALNRHDSNSTAFRYPNARDGSPSLDGGLRTINLNGLAKNMDAAITLLDGAASQMAHLLDIRDEIQSSYPN